MPSHANSQAMQRRTLRLEAADSLSVMPFQWKCALPSQALSIAGGEANGRRFLMKLAAAHQPPRDVGGLQRRALGRRMGGEIAGDGDQDVPALVGVAPLAELPHAGLQHLIGVEARVLAQQRARERGDERPRRVAEREMARDQTRRELDLPLAIEGVEQSGAECLDIGGQVVEPSRRRRRAGAPAAR